ncbi:MAG TPA: hypothetical protein VHI78_06825 [Bacteroidales bacterium]|jgi:hypothetical protein|nr:hypothetical protein [Bacteroidales bacterium]
MRNILAVTIMLFVFMSCEKDENTDSSTFTSKTVSMGQNSDNDVYYSLANGEVSNLNRSGWDIAFSVPLQTATILINEGAGVELYCVGDTNDWNAVDENSISGLSPRFNDESDRTMGAFNVNATGFPNYGWGTYHGGNPDHNVGGDSIYVIKLTDGSFKKFMVRVKLGTSSSNEFRWADLNGENEMTASLSTAPYEDKKHFIHYSIVNNEPVEAEPDMTEWDLLFTRYLIKIPVGPSVFMDYPVMGVLSNPDVRIAKVTGKHPDEVTESDAVDFSDRPDVIGHDWKISDPVTHEISLADSTSYFIESVDGKTYLLYFSDYGGNADGTIGFKVKTID